MQTKLAIINISPKKAFIRPESNNLRLLCFDVAISSKFEILTMTSIIFNMVLLATVYSGISPVVESIHKITNYILTSIFISEALIKILAFKYRYFQDKWNIFDFTLVIISLAYNLLGGGTTTSLLARTLKMGRMVKLINGLKRMQIIYNTFMNTFSSLVSVGCPMLLIIYINAIFGMNFFANIKMSYPIHDRLNF